MSIILFSGRQFPVFPGKTFGGTTFALQRDDRHLSNPASFKLFSLKKLGNLTNSFFGKSPLPSSEPRSNEKIRTKSFLFYGQTIQFGHHIRIFDSRIAYSPCSVPQQREFRKQRNEDCEFFRKGRENFAEAEMWALVLEMRGHFRFRGFLIGISRVRNLCFTPIALLTAKPDYTSSYRREFPTSIISKNTQREPFRKITSKSVSE